MIGSDNWPEFIPSELALELRKAHSEDNINDGVEDDVYSVDSEQLTILNTKRDGTFEN